MPKVMDPTDSDRIRDRKKTAESSAVDNSDLSRDRSKNAWKYQQRRRTSQQSDESFDPTIFAKYSDYYSADQSSIMKQLDNR